MPLDITTITELTTCPIKTTYNIVTTYITGIDTTQTTTITTTVPTVVATL